MMKMKLTMISTLLISKSIKNNFSSEHDSCLSLTHH